MNCCASSAARHESGIMVRNRIAVQNRTNRRDNFFSEVAIIPSVDYLSASATDASAKVATCVKMATAPSTRFMATAAPVPAPTVPIA